MFQENSIKACILSRVKQITSPGWMHETSAQAWYTGKTQRNRVEREVGGGIGMGNTCKSMADSCQCSPSILIVGTTAELSVKKRVEHEAGSPMFSLLLEVPTTGWYLCWLHTADLWSLWVKLKWVTWDTPVYPRGEWPGIPSDPCFPGRTKEKELFFPVLAFIHLPRQSKHCLWEAVKFLVWALNPWPPRKR